MKKSLMSRNIARREFLAATAAVVSTGSLASAGSKRSKNKKQVASKKGCCFVAKQVDRCLDRTHALDASWLYTWGDKRPSGLPEEVEFCPMMWGNSSEEKLAAKIETLRPLVKSGQVQHLMGFNEPDQKNQSDMTVERVLELWPILMELNVPLVSPGCVHPDREWMDEFMEGVEQRNLRVDYVAAHSYGGPNASHLLNRMEKVSKRFGRPVWITEFAVGDWEAKSVEQHKHSTGSVQAFMKQVLPALNAAPFVARYAWFAADQKNKALGTSALFDDDGELTRLGRIYANG